MAPYSEAARVGVHVATLIAFGNAAGRAPHVVVGATNHHLNEFAVFVGPTATGRKSEAIRLGIRPVALADEVWAARVVRGFGSGESLVEAVNDDQEDKRMLVFEDEFSLPLTIAARKGSTISGLLRSAWDGARMENRTKGNVIVASDAHVSFLAGITPDELLRLVAATDVANGFLNRFLLVGVKRARLLPSPPPIRGDLEAEYIGAFRDALTVARTTERPMRRTRDADALWVDAYRSELSVDRMGLSGAACSRADAHTLRLSLLYALLDQSDVIEEIHVRAALALWRYAEHSAKSLFGERTGNPIADSALKALQAAGVEGLSRTELRNHFSRHIAQEELDVALDFLLAAGLITEQRTASGGRPLTRYFATEIPVWPDGDES